MSAAPAAAQPPAARSLGGDAPPRWIILGVALGVVVLSLLLSLGSEPGEVVVPLLNRPLPPLCTMKRVAGLDCPGCGMTRSFIAAAHGRWREAFRFNGAGPLWFAVIAGQIPYQAYQLSRIGRRLRPIDAGWWGQAVIYFGLAALILQWIVRTGALLW
jgi:hypothetical protein